ncbi:hypothetical protein FB45DRAFT_352209 [Roridomyces roridus]|uniref:F-box domain-containing protein n=1 Tax=Roridomyces roridus TaxID=1738132 RepID=A0AAD7C753_9AGAR|nr:hypothetical protein FB45DRAFT_352209 [Roridomyces roridus]
MSHMPHGVKFRVEFVLENDDELDAYEPPTTTSNISHLSMNIVDYFDLNHCTLVLNNTLKSLTLPHLSKLSFSVREFPRDRICWPHAGFMACAHRSSFQTSLESLLLEEVVITEVELLACLAAVPSLKYLSIGDHQSIPGSHGEEKDHGVDHHLTTNSLLSKLTLVPGSASLSAQALIPNLRTLTFRSRLQFDDNVFLDFVLSRRVQPTSRPLTCLVEWLAGDFREIDVDVSARLRELRAGREAIVCFSAGYSGNSED